MFIKSFLEHSLNQDSVTEIIKKELKRWKSKYGINTCDINTGDCFVFAERIEGILRSNGYSDVEVLTTDSFYDLANKHEYDEDKDNEIWYKESDYNSFKPDGFIWPEWGFHGWIYVNGKHYDADNVNGVKNFYDLPIFKRFIKN
jgi:hypothetical protein